MFAKSIFKCNEKVLQLHEISGAGGGLTVEDGAAAAAAVSPVYHFGGHSPGFF